MKIGRGGGEGKVNSYSECQRWNPAHLKHDRNHCAEQNKRPWQFVTENAFDDVRHQSCFRRIELLHCRAIRTNPVCAVDAGIDEVNGNALLVNQIALSSTALWIDALPDVICFRIRSSL